MKLTSIMHI